MPLVGFRDRNTATTLEGMARERKLESRYERTIPNPNAVTNRQQPTLSQTNSFIVILDGPIPAAAKNEDDEWVVQAGQGSVYLREYMYEDGNSQDPEDPVSSTTPFLVPWLDSDGQEIKKRVWNFLPLAASPGYPFQVLEDVHGDLYIPGVVTGVVGVPFKNVSGHTVPPGGVMLIDGTVTLGGFSYAACYRPDIFDRFYLINGPTAILNGGFGQGSWMHGDTPWGVAVDGAFSPSPGDSWGPKKDSFLLFRDRPGFTPLTGTFTLNGQLCMTAKQHEVHEAYGRYYQDLNKNGEAEFIIGFHHPTTNVLVDSDWPRVLVRDCWLETGKQVAANTEGTIRWWNGPLKWNSNVTLCRPIV
jgi:hypothetical protein